MNFWDSSSLLPLVVDEIHSNTAKKFFRQDPHLFIWWGTPIECVSALARKQREGRLTHNEFMQAREKLHYLESISTRVLPSESLKTTAEALLIRHALRCADALQLAASLVLRTESEMNLVFLSEDNRLCQAAEKEGFTVIRFEAF